MRNTHHLILCFLAFFGCLATSALAQMTLTKIYEFTDHDSPLQNCGLVESPDGKLYGWSGQAGADRRSLLFRIKLMFIGQTGREYQIQFTDSLPPTWLPAQTITADPQGNVEFTDDTVNVQGSRFFRVVTE